jgi:hypothetical protein
MKRWLIFLLPLMMFLSSLPLAAQEDLSIDDSELILRRVYFQPLEVEGSASVPALYRDIPDTLYALITRSQPILRVHDVGDAYSVVSVTISGSPASGEGGTVVARFELKTGDDDPVLVEEQLSVPSNHEQYSALMESVSKAFFPLLGRVAPEIRLSAVETDEETQELLEIILFEEAVATPFELNLWMGIGSKNLDGDKGNSQSFVFLLPSHWFLEFSWYPGKNSGLTGSFLFSRSSRFSYGWQPGQDDVPADSMNTIIMPGIGYSYRTLGPFSAGFSFGYNAGILNLRAYEDLVIDQGSDVIAEGTSQTWFKQLVTLRAWISRALNRKWSLKTSLTFYMDFVLLIDSHDSVHISDLQFLNLALCYRWD